MATFLSTTAEAVTIDDFLDETYTVRQLLELIALVRSCKPRDGLRMLEGSILDLRARANTNAP